MAGHHLEQKAGKIPHLNRFAEKQLPSHKPAGDSCISKILCSETMILEHSSIFKKYPVSL
jgi:hypothetical protein